MKEIKNLKLIREKIKHFKAMENKILKEDLDKDFGKITRRFFDVFIFARFRKKPIPPLWATNGSKAGTM